MGANSTQGLAVPVFPAAFTCLAAALFEDGNLFAHAALLGGNRGFRRAVPEGQILGIQGEIAK
jgi:hypothetical protein